MHDAEGLALIQSMLPPEVAKWAAPAIRLHHDAWAEELPLGATRIGGRPDVPLGFKWPRWRGACMDFWAQIDLAELPLVTGREALPPLGWLCFFYTAYADTWGRNPQEAGSFAVLHLQGPRAALQPDHRDPQDDLDTIFPPFAVQLAPMWTLPSSASAQVQGQCWGPEERHAYLEAELALIRRYDTDRGASWLLGHDAQFQSQDLRALCEANGPPGEGPWRLLLQLAPPDAWGFAGVLSFFIREGDLAAGRFERGWVVRED